MKKIIIILLSVALFACVILAFVIPKIKLFNNSNPDTPTISLETKKGVAIGSSGQNDEVSIANFPYTFDIPEDWVKGIIKGSSFPDMLIQPPTPEISPTDKYFISPSVDITLLNKSYNVHDIISGMKTYNLNTSVTKAGQYKCDLYNGSATSAHKEYIRDIALIYTDKHIVFIDASGDNTQKARVDGIITTLIASFLPR